MPQCHTRIAAARSGCDSNVIDFKAVFLKRFHLFSYNFVRFGRFACFGRFARFGGFVWAVSFRCFGFST